MSNPELNEITASVQAAIARAYALGRLDALKHVITAIEAEEAGVDDARPLALMGPQPGETAPEATVPPARDEVGASEAMAISPHPDLPAPDLPANDDRADDPAVEAIRLPWYRRSAN